MHSTLLGVHFWFLFSKRCTSSQKDGDLTADKSKLGSLLRVYSIAFTHLPVPLNKIALRFSLSMNSIIAVYSRFLVKCILSEERGIHQT